ncbi:MAG: aminotransferase class IV [Pseudothermotoga sp.]
MLVWKGRWLKKPEATLSVDEPGLLYGGVPYETLRTYQHRLFAGKYHYDRLTVSAKYLGMEIPMSYEQFRQVILQGLEEFDGDVSIRVLLLPRGKISAFSYQLDFCELVVYMDQLKVSPLHEKVKVKVSKIRKIDPTATPADLKAVGRTDILLAKATKGDAYDVLMLGSKGQLCEGTFTNLFIVKNGRVVTPSLDSGILPGITRKNVIGLCNSLLIPVEERWVELSELYGADEVFLTHTSRGIVPVDELDGWRVFSKSLGEFLSQRFEDYINSIEENWI